MLSLKNLSVVALTLAASSVFAGPTVSYSTFGSLPAANFGGSGIPNDAVAMTNLDSVVLGLTAHQRYGSPAVGNNGAGVFQAGAGTYAMGDNLALWNYGFYIGGNALTAYTYKLFADYNPAVGDLDDSYQDITAAFLTVAAGSFATAGTIQNSENLGFGTAVAQFNPDVAGQYGFILAAYNQSNTEIGRSAILVNVGDVPEPASLALVGVAMLGVVGAMRRRSR